MKIIPRFLGEHRFLSNFHLCTIGHEGFTYPSTENAYQAAKTLNPDIRQEFTNMTPSEAQKAGQVLFVRTDWEQVKWQIMLDVTREKYFKHPDLAKMLLDTGSAYLMEGTWWHDNYWGVCTCKECKGLTGSNNLGIILMKVRNELAIREVM